ncbi:Uu.00g024650.m01.CDS01 [Anthostomella pinea]|uniref:Uu.00g024650.m01.CDS01 n=1 Tax=Anthostomella pinea TaxID=933095 RepID=A0AAI8YR78_9PEZI|nr:Uu.00g024650.m01.CDS01 [Anthostomella pinea]
MTDLVKTNRRRLSSPKLPLPSCEGPRLRAFQYRDKPIEWLGMLDDSPEVPSSSRQGYVFKVKVNSRIYALKVFKFFKPTTYRWHLGPEDGRKVSDDTLEFHTDPFYAECRAYGRLQEARRKQGLKRRDFADCHGFLALSKKDTAYIEEELGIELWDVPPSDEYRQRAQGSPIRAIVKEFITSDPAIDSRALAKMIKGLGWINKNGVLVWDIHARNYRGGILVDFGSSWTRPHCL